MRRSCNKSNFIKCDMWSLIHTNIRGYDSKALSLHAIVDKADVVTINETFLKNDRKLNINLGLLATIGTDRASMGVELQLVSKIRIKCTL